MMMDEFFAMLFVFVTVITVLRYAAELVRRRMQLKERELELRLGQSAAPAQPTIGAQQLARIEERLRVLERIATSRDTRLADEIEALRAPVAAVPEAVSTQSRLADPENV